MGFVRYQRSSGGAHCQITLFMLSEMYEDVAPPMQLGDRMAMVALYYWEPGAFCVFSVISAPVLASIYASMLQLFQLIILWYCLCLVPLPVALAVDPVDTAYFGLYLR